MGQPLQSSTRISVTRELIGLDRIDSGIEALSAPGSLKVTIERAGK